MRRRQGKDVTHGKGELAAENNGFGSTWQQDTGGRKKND